MKIIIRNPNDDTNAKFKLKALADGIITVNAPVGAIIKNEDNEWLTCLSGRSALISCAGASNKLFIPFDFDAHIADRPAGLESFWDWSMNGGYGDTPYGGWEAVFNSMREDDKIVDWDIYVDEIKIGTTHIVPLSRLNESDPGYDENEMDLWFNEILSTVKGLGVYYPDAINPNEINADIETFFNGIVQTDGIDVVMPHKTIRALYGLVLVNKTSKPMRIKFVPSNPLVTMGNRWIAGFGIRPHSLTENYAYLLDLQPLAETMRGNDAVTVDPVDGSISICLEAAPKVISCAGASTTFELRSDLSSRTTEIQVNDGAWVDLFETIDGLSVTFQPNNPGALLTLSNTSGEDMRIRLRASKDFGLYVNSDGEENLRTNMVEQSNQAYTLFDADGNIIDPRLESNKDYSGRDFDDTGTNNDYAIYFRSAEFCLAAMVEETLISCDGAGSDLDLRVQLHKGAGGGYIEIVDPITGDVIASGQGSDSNGEDNVADLITVALGWTDKIGILNYNNTFHDIGDSIQSSVGIVNKTTEPMRLEINVFNIDASSLDTPALTNVHVGDATTAIYDESVSGGDYLINVCIAPDLTPSCVPSPEQELYFNLDSSHADKTVVLGYKIDDLADGISTGKVTYTGDTPANLFLNLYNATDGRISQQTREPSDLCVDGISVKVGWLEVADLGSYDSNTYGAPKLDYVIDGEPGTITYSGGYIYKNAANHNNATEARAYYAELYQQFADGLIALGFTVELHDGTLFRTPNIGNYFSYILKVSYDPDLFGSVTIGGNKIETGNNGPSWNTASFSKECAVYKTAFNSPNEFGTMIAGYDETMVSNFVPRGAIITLDTCENLGITLEEGEVDIFYSFGKTEPVVITTCGGSIVG